MLPNEPCLIVIDNIMLKQQGNTVFITIEDEAMTVYWQVPLDDIRPSFQQALQQAAIQNYFPGVTAI